MNWGFFLERKPEKMASLQDSIDRVNQKYKSLKVVRIVVLDDVPPIATATATKAKACVSTCKAINLNGTPCKLKTKIGQYCMKHCP